jgi:hypothetical protein
VLKVFLLLMVGLAFGGGYGDPVDGLPSFSERELHLWTNLARVAPADFDSEYARGGCSWSSFQESEKNPIPPLMWHLGLNDAARFHSVDMATNNHFSHSSSDGTSFGDRVSRYYSSGYVGENIAYGAGPFYSVFSMWMCSPGHRSNIMEDGFNELGTGVDGTYLTQDFGGRENQERVPVAMGIHYPQIPEQEVTFYADFYDEGGDTPDRFSVVYNGVVHDLTPRWGSASMGVFLHETEVQSAECHEYFFKAWVGGREVRFPETGSYGWGECDFADVAAGWISTQWGDPSRDLNEGKGCAAIATAGTGIPVAMWLSLVALGFRRTRLQASKSAV